MQGRFNAALESLLSRVNCSNVAVTRLGVCLSGGPDSMSLLYLSRSWALEKSDQRDIVAIHVNHAIRKEANEEAQRIEKEVERMGSLRFVSGKLSWESHNMSKSHEALRRRRYAMLGEMGASVGACALLTAHHRNDCTETFVQRIQMASGVSGLAHPIASVMNLPTGFPPVLRPLLSATKQDLQSVLPPHQWVVKDPLNEDPKYLRSRVRRWIDESDTDERLWRVWTTIAHEWSHIERTASELKKTYGVDVDDMKLNGGLVDVLKNRHGHDGIAATLVVRNVLASAKKSQRFRSCIVEHCVDWMCHASTRLESYCVWSESGVRVTWRRKTNTFTFQSEY